MRHPELTIDLLRAFVAIADAGSFVGGATMIGLSQSTISQRVLRLEEVLQRRVFNRTSRSLHLTHDGEEILVAARHMLRLNDTIMDRLQQSQAIGTLRLGISEDFIPRHMPRLLTRFKRLYPGIHLELMNGLSGEMLEAHDAGRLDLTIAKRDSMARNGRIIWREPLVWMAAADYPLELAQRARLVMLRPPCPYRALMIETLDSVRHKWTTSCSVGSVTAAQSAVAGGLGVTVLGRSFVLPGMQILQPPEHWPALPLTEIIVIGEETAEAKLVRPLLTFLTENLAASDGQTMAA